MRDCHADDTKKPLTFLLLHDPPLPKKKHGYAFSLVKPRILPMTSLINGAREIQKIFITEIWQWKSQYLPLSSLYSAHSPVIKKAYKLHHTQQDCFTSNSLQSSLCRILCKSGCGFWRGLLTGMVTSNIMFALSANNSHTLSAKRWLKNSIFPTSSITINFLLARLPPFLQMAPSSATLTAELPKTTSPSPPPFPAPFAESDSTRAGMARCWKESRSTRYLPTRGPPENLAESSLCDSKKKKK